MKWKYDKKFIQWYTSWDWDIVKTEDNEYMLTRWSHHIIGRFKFLKNAKLVAELIEEG